jgi:nucleoside-triphosphatase THEP1
MNGPVFPNAEMTTQSLTDLPRIVAVQGGARNLIQALLSHVAVSWRAKGLRIAGVVEEIARDNARETVLLRDLQSGACYPLKQDLGSGSTSCSLDLASLAAACLSVETAIEQGCDFVILNKFGKMEASGSGLAGAFYAAIAADKPIITSVSPSLTEAWSEFANPLTMFVKPDYGAIENWRLGLANFRSTVMAGLDP